MTIGFTRLRNQMTADLSAVMDVTALTNVTGTQKLVGCVISLSLSLHTEQSEKYPEDLSEAKKRVITEY